MMKFSAFLLLAAALAACSPALDWREVHGGTPPFHVLLPAKPATLSRPINLGGVQATMTMTAAEVDGVTFAVGCAELPSAAQAFAALTAMKTAMLRNINGRITHEQTTTGPVPATEIAATGIAATQAGVRPVGLAARFVVSDKWVYQIIVLGPEKALQRDAIDTFFTSFKPS